MGTDDSLHSRDHELSMVRSVDDGADTTDPASTERTRGDGDAEEDPTALREVKELAKVETKRMRQWKILVVLGILLTGAAVSWGIFFILRQQQDDNFKSQVGRPASADVQTAVSKSFI